MRRTTSERVLFFRPPSAPLDVPVYLWPSLFHFHRLFGATSIVIPFPSLPERWRFFFTSAVSFLIIIVRALLSSSRPWRYVFTIVHCLLFEVPACSPSPTASAPPCAASHAAAGHRFSKLARAQRILCTGGCISCGCLMPFELNYRCYASTWDRKRTEHTRETSNRNQPLRQPADLSSYGKSRLSLPWPLARSQWKPMQSKTTECRHHGRCCGSSPQNEVVGDFYDFPHIMTWPCCL